jgi:hypothetical protein
MQERPTLDTTRLVLRPFTVADAPDVQRLAGAREVASTTLRIPASLYHRDGRILDQHTPRGLRAW